MSHVETAARPLQNPELLRAGAEKPNGFSYQPNPYKRCFNMRGRSLYAFVYTEGPPGSIAADDPMAIDAARICMGCPRLDACIEYGNNWRVRARGIKSPRNRVNPGVIGAQLLVPHITGRQVLPIVVEGSEGIERGISFEDELHLLYQEQLENLSVVDESLLTKVVALVFSQNPRHTMTISEVKDICRTLGMDELEVSEIVPTVHRVHNLLSLHRTKADDIDVASYAFTKETNLVEKPVSSIEPDEPFTPETTPAISIEEPGVADAPLKSANTVEKNYDLDELVVRYRDHILFGEGELPSQNEVNMEALMGALLEAEDYGIHFKSVDERRNIVHRMLGLDEVDEFEELVIKTSNPIRATSVMVRPKTEQPTAPTTPHWRQLGACRGLDPDIFYPDDDDEALEAKHVCADCGVRVECLEYALQVREKSGVWGGATERERRRMIRRHRRSY